MTPQEALGQALKRQADEAGEWCDDPVGVAEEVLAALPEGWALTNGITNIEDWPIWQQARDEGAHQERERLRALVKAHQDSVPHCPAASEMYEFLEEPEALPDSSRGVRRDPVKKAVAYTTLTHDDWVMAEDEP